MRGPSLDAETVARIMRFYERRLSRRQISEITGVPYDTVTRLITRVNRGECRFQSTRMKSHDAKIEELTAKGMSARQIAARIGSHKGAICNRRRAIGLDAEECARLRRQAREQPEAGLVAKTRLAAVLSPPARSSA